jgi:hypothetical protein
MLILLGEKERALATLEEAANVPHLRPYLPFINVSHHSTLSPTTGAIRTCVVR